MPPYNALFPPPPPTGLAPLGGFGQGQGLGGSLLTQALFAQPAPAVGKWLFVTRRFDRILANLTISDQQREDGETKQAGVRACLNRYYWNSSSDSANSLLIGSWSKYTRVRPSRDIDILFLLPASVYHRFQGRSGNRQSQLLQEVKSILAQTYGQTRMRADGQVIVVPFNTIPIEVSLGFRCQDGSIIVCDANEGGSYRTSTAEAEAVDLAAVDATWNGNARALSRLMKQWQRENNVPLKSFQIERLAVEFLRGWPYRSNNRFWYDWMVRDFFAFLLGRANSTIVMPGTGEVVSLGNEWVSRARSAYLSAVSACDNERDNYQALAGGDWQKIFGSAAPVLLE